MTRRRTLILPATAMAALATAPLLGGIAAAAESTVVVQAGDTLSDIALRHDVDVPQLAALNGISNPHRIYAGQRLQLTDDTTSDEPVATAPRTHTVRSGENLTWIARRYGVSVGAIVAANRITDPSRIYAGQRLTIPGTADGSTGQAGASGPKASDAESAKADAAASAATTHTVRSGENLTWIARRYGITIGAIVAANRITDPSRIYAGQRLTIPGTATATAGAGGAAMPAEMARLVAKRDAVRRIIVEQAQRYGVPAALALAVAWHESGWQQKVVSSAGAVGVMQLLPTTAEWVGSAMLGGRVDVRDARSNVRAGVRLLAHYLDRYDGNRELALAAYYQGQRATDGHGVYPVSRPYIASILALERLFAG
jgi:LysM repeat protein